MKSLSRLFFTLSLISFGLFLNSIGAKSLAQVGGGRLYNDKYILHQANFNFTSGKASNASYGLGFTGGELAQGLFSGANYIVRSGFQYYYSIIPFEFAVSSQFVDFGPLVPGTPVTRTNRLTLSNGSAFGYEVLVFENHPLRNNPTGLDIPDTTCDSGTCSETTAAAWTLGTTYGFGYRCDDITGTECSSDFATSTFYKQFASSESAELAQPVMSGSDVGRDFESEVTYKVNISSTQPAGLYQNQIIYVAVPSI